MCKESVEMNYEYDILLISKISSVIDNISMQKKFCLYEQRSRYFLDMKPYLTAVGFL